MCGDDAKCWREYALLARTQAQNEAGIYWAKVELRHKDKLASVEPCKEEDLICWKRLARVAREADKAMTELRRVDSQ